MRISTLQQTEYSARQTAGRGGRATVGDTTYHRSVDGCSAILSAGARLHLEARRAYQVLAEERAGRIDRLRQQVQSGAYKVDTAGLCDTLLAISQNGSCDG